jgi:hypothetical protein
MTNKQRKKEQRLNDSTAGGSYNGNVIQNGQWNKRNVYCPECHSFNGVPHAIGCKGRKVRISPTARIPKKNSSQKVWDRFYEKFVNCRHYKKHSRPEWKL